MVAIIVLSSVLLTSLISGVLGMAGGVILMGILGLLLPIEYAMLVHGVSQFTANGARAILSKQYIYWPVVKGYVRGVATIMFLTAFYFPVPSKKVMFLALSLFALLGVLPAISSKLDITKKFRGYFCGLLVTPAQLIAGASGGALDIFFQDPRLNRFQVVATKSLTQTVSHLVKCLFYSNIINFHSIGTQIPLSLIPAIIMISIIGTFLGKLLIPV